LKQPKLCKKIESDNSSDSEENSVGDNNDPYRDMFDIESMSTESEEEALATEEIEKIKEECENDSEELLSFDIEETCRDDNIIDGCSYYDECFFLTHDGTIIGKQHKNNRKINCNRRLHHLVSFDGHSYAVDKKGTLCMLDITYYNTNYWVFKPVKWFKKKVKSVSTTLDSNYIWLQIGNKGYLYDTQLVKEKVKTHKRRVYGKTPDTYLEFDDNYICDVYINNRHIKTINNVLSGVIDWHNDIYLLNVSDKHIYNDIKIIKHKHYYIKHR
jgi:hypothetical protein